MIDSPLLQSVLGLAGTPLVMALVNILVKPFTPDGRFYPVAALAIGIGWNVGLAFLFTLPINTAVVLGVVTGLAASGVYSASKALAPISLSTPSPRAAAEVSAVATPSGATI